MIKLMNLLMLSCKKATLLIEKRQGFSLSIKEKMQVKLHASMCNACRSYEKQNSVINGAISNWFLNDTVKKETLSKDVKDRIINKIKQ